eukprot:1072827_1
MKSRKGNLFSLYTTNPKQNGNEEIREWIKEGTVIARKFKKELMHDEVKKREFIQFIHNKFNTKWFRNNPCSESALNLQENMKLMNSDIKQHNIRKNKNNNKHQFIQIELQKGNDDA